MTRQDTSKSSVKNKSISNTEKGNSSFHCLYKSIREGSGAENYLIYKQDKTDEVSKGINEEYNLLEITKHMEESFQKQKSLSVKNKLKKTLEPKKKKKNDLSRSNLYSKKNNKISTKSRKREPRNVSSFSRIGSKVKNNVSIENRKRRRNISNQIVDSKRKNKSKSKPKLKRKRQKKNQVIMNNIDNSQNVYNNYFINLKQAPDAEGVDNVNHFLKLISGQKKFSKQSNCKGEGLTEDVEERETADCNRESRFLEESTQRLKNSIISVKQIFEANSGQEKTNWQNVETNLYKEKKREGKKGVVKKYNPFTITNGISYDFESANKTNQQVLKKFSMSMKNVNPVIGKKFSKTSLKKQPFSLTETDKLITSSPERSRLRRFNEDEKGTGEEFNMYKKKFFEKQKDVQQIYGLRDSALTEESKERKNKKEGPKVMLYERKKSSQKIINKFVKKSNKSREGVNL